MATRVNLIANIIQIIDERGISFKSSGNTYGVSDSSRPHAYLIETVITPGVAYSKVRSLLRKENILYLHQVQSKDGSLMTWMDFTRKYRQSNSGRIPKWFKILESTIIMDEHRNINVAQCETVGMHKIDYQIPDDLDTIQRDFIYIQISNALLPQWRNVRDKLRLRKKIEISMNGSLVKADSEDARGAAAFVTHGIEANFGIAVNETLSSTKTEAKAVLLALEAVLYKCKLTLNTDSQAVVSTAQKWLSKNSPLSIRNQLKTPNWCTWNVIKAVIREKRIDLIINKVAAHTGISENEMADKLAKEATIFDTVDWAYNAENISYIPSCREVELDLNIRHFLSQQTGIQGALDWIGNDKVQETVGSLDQRVDWKSTTKVWNWDGKMSSGFTLAGSSAMHTFIMKSFHNMLSTAEVLYNRHLLVYINNLCKICHTEVETNQHFWVCSLNTQKGKTLIDDVRNEWMWCLSKAVRGKHKILDPSERVVLSNKYIRTTHNIDLLCKKLINEQFERINAFADIDQRANDNILIKVCKWAVTQARNRLWRECCKLQTEWEKIMSVDNRFKKNPLQVTSICQLSRNGSNSSGNSNIKMRDGFQHCNKILTDVLGSRITLSNEPVKMLLFSKATLESKPITAMYTDAKVDTDEATKILIGKIDDFLFKVNDHAGALAQSEQSAYAKAYQVSWADTDHNNLPPVSTNYCQSKLICINCGKKLSTMEKWNNKLCLACGETFLDKGIWNNIFGQRGMCNKAKNKKVANVTFPIGFSVIEATRQNIPATFSLKNTSEKLLLAVSGSFSFPLARSSSPVKVPSKRHTWISSSVVSITSKSPKIFNNRPVNKLVFSALTTTITSTTTTALQMAMKAKNSKKQQQAVTTAMVTLNPFVVPDEILEKISTAAVSPLPDIDGNSNNTSHKIRKDQPQAVLPDVKQNSIIPDDLKDWADQMEMESTAPPPVSGTADGGAWENVNGRQKFSGWVASNLVSGSTFKIKMALLNAVKLFCVEFAFQKSLNGAIKVAISDEVFLTTLKIVCGFCIFPSSVCCTSQCSLGIFSDDIKAALGIFGVVTSIKLKPAGLWQYTVHWSVLVKKDSVRILLVINQKEIIASSDAFKAKLLVAESVSFLNLLIHTDINALLWCQDLNHLAVDCKIAKFYAKAVAFVVLPAATTAGIDPVLGAPSKVVVPMVPVVSPVPIAVVESRLASMESHFNKLALLVKSIIEPVGSLVVLVTKLLSTPPAVDMTLRESVVGLERQVKTVAAVASMLNRDVKSLTKKCDQISLEDLSDDDDMDDDNDKDKDFSVYDDTFDVMMQLWEGQPPSIKSNPDQTAKWMSGMVKNSHELVSIMDKMYEFDMFNTFGSKYSTNV
ncbi:hypothetical protein G9A89_002768 [Geosiphon pyriformis]|nr:hypothetical protein G9A89_002768 [Geosiphon pyriformis]